MELLEDNQLQPNNVLQAIQEEEEEDMSSSMEAPPHHTSTNPLPENDAPNIQEQGGKDFKYIPDFNKFGDILADMGKECSSSSENKQENESSSNEPFIVTFYDEGTRDTYWRCDHIGVSTQEDDTQHVFTAGCLPYLKEEQMKDPEAYAKKKSPKGDLFLAVKIIPNPNLKVLMKFDQELERSGNVPEHINIVGLSKIPFKDKGNTYLVFPHMNYGSMRYIMQTEIRYGLPEVSILAVLQETLKGLSLIHETGQVHKEINAGHIFMNDKAEIKLAFSVTVFEEDEILEKPISSAPSMIFICNWAAAPEIYDKPDYEYTPESDIWMIGVTALELAYGEEFRVRNRADFESMVKNIRYIKKLPWKGKGKITCKFVSNREKDPGGRLTDQLEKRRFSKGFGKMVADCLSLKPRDRPSAAELLENRIFSKIDTDDLKRFRNLVEMLKMRG